jgi:hypothetical protein
MMVVTIGLVVDALNEGLSETAARSHWRSRVNE